MRRQDDDSRKSQEDKTEKKEPSARLNPVVREFFKERFKGMSFLEEFPENSKAFDKNLDRLIEHHTQEVKKRTDQLREERQTLLQLCPSKNQALELESAEKIKNHLKIVIRLLGQLDTELFFMRQALALNYRFDPQPPKETETFSESKDLQDIVYHLERLDKAIDNFYYSRSPSISFQELAEEPIPLLIEKIRKLADRAAGNL